MGGRGFVDGCVYHPNIAGLMYTRTDNGRGSGEHIAVDPNSGNILFMAGSSWDLSKDVGATWAMVHGQPTGLIPTSGCIQGTTAYFSFNNGIGPNNITAGKVMRFSTTDVFYCLGHTTCDIYRPVPGLLPPSNAIGWTDITAREHGEYGIITGCRIV